MIIDPAGKYSIGGSGVEKLQEPRSAGEQGLGGHPMRPKTGLLQTLFNHRGQQPDRRLPPA